MLKHQRIFNNSQPTLHKKTKKTPTLYGITWVDGLVTVVLQLQSNKNQLKKRKFKPRARETLHQIYHEESDKMKSSGVAFKTKLVKCLLSKQILREIYGEQERVTLSFLRGPKIVLTFLRLDQDQVMKKGMQIALIIKM